jgi:hypothetical protein
MKDFLKSSAIISATIGCIALMVIPAVSVATGANSVARKQKIIDAELKLQAVRTGLGEFYVSTNTATIEFRLKPTP